MGMFDKQMSSNTVYNFYVQRPTLERTAACGLWNKINGDRNNSFLILYRW